MVKNLPASAGDTGSVPGLGRSPGEEMVTHSIGSPDPLAWKIPWMEKPGRLQSVGSQRVGHDLVSKQQTTIPQDKWTTRFLEMERSKQFLCVSSLI